MSPEDEEWFKAVNHALHDRHTELALENAALRAELDQWTKWGVIEVAIRNPSVAEYMRHWEGRATKAEAEVDRLSGNKDEVPK